MPMNSDGARIIQYFINDHENKKIMNNDEIMRIKLKLK